MDKVFTILGSLGIKYDRFDHPSVTTVTEAMEHLSSLPGIKIKNLLLQDKNNQYYLVFARLDTKIQINALGKKLNIPSPKMANPSAMQYFKIETGAMCPFIALNDTNHILKIFCDPSIGAEEKLMFHPLQNNVSIVLTKEDLDKFLQTVGYSDTQF